MKRIKYGKPAFVCFFLGILALSFGITSLVKRNQYVPVEAVITRIIEEYHGSDEGTDYTVYARYTVDGIEYEEDIGFFAPKFEVGKVIEIRYDPADPRKVEAASPGFLIYLIIIGAALVVGGWFFLFHKEKPESEEEEKDPLGDGNDPTEK